jgi:hypothetical protein
MRPMKKPAKNTRKTTKAKNKILEKRNTTPKKNKKKRQQQKKIKGMACYHIFFWSITSDF